MDELLPAVNLDETLTNIMNELLGESILNCETSNTSFDSSYTSERENVQPCTFETFCENAGYIPEVNVSSDTLRLILRALSGDNSSFCAETSAKKRPRQPDKWQQNIRKKLRQSGKPYTDKHGIQRAGRKMGLPCGEACFYQCTKNISEKARAELHNKYWSLSDVEKKAYIFLSVQSSEVKRRRGPNALRKTRTFLYYFETNKATVQVCKKFFLSTIGISERKIYYLYNNSNYEEGVAQQKPKIRGRPRRNVVKMQAQTVGEQFQEIEDQGLTAEKLDLPCEDTCLYQCTKRFNDEARKELHNKYRNLSDEEKELYILESVKKSVDFSKTHSFDYFIETNIATFQVCEKFFLNTIGIAESIIYNLFNPSTYEVDISEPKNNGIPSTNIDEIEEVTEHVLSFYAL